REPAAPMANWVASSITSSSAELTPCHRCRRYRHRCRLPLTAPLPAAPRARVLSTLKIEANISECLCDLGVIRGTGALPVAQQTGNHPQALSCNREPPTTGKPRVCLSLRRQACGDTISPRGGKGTLGDQCLKFWLC